MTRQGALADLRVIDASTLFAGPLAAMLLGDFGADVLKLEHPRGDPARTHGKAKDGVPLWWKLIGRNKRAITLYLGTPEGQDLFRRLARNVDIIVENFRPGTLERWNLGYDTLAADNPGLILVRVTAYGQFGPYSRRPGFGTIAEAMSGFAAITGQADGPPTLPPFGLADGITGIAAALAAMMAVHSRQQTGRGQVVDIALIEPIVTVLGAQAVIFDQLRHVQQRTGNRSVKNAPRNTYKTADGKWVAISTSSTTIAERVMRIVGWPEVISEPWFSSARGRFEHVEALDRRVADWVGRHSCREVVAAFDEAEAAAAPIYDISDVFADPQFQALDTITTVQDDQLGALRMQNVLFRLSRDKGAIRHAGRPLGADNEAVYRDELGLSVAQMADLAARGVI
jgi:formyl-CoA transferase